MSGFERSAPIPGSQGPRRSQMVRYNNAPPPESPWRLEVLEAKKQAEAAIKRAKGGASRSRSRDRDRERERDRDRDRDRRKASGGGAGGGSGGGSSSSKASANKVVQAPQEKDTLLRKVAMQHGEGWFAAVAAAASSWDPANLKKPGGKPDAESASGIASSQISSGNSDKRKVEGKKKAEAEEREKARMAREQKERLERELNEEATRREDQRVQQEQLERQWHAEAEAREKRRLEEKKRLDEERRHKEQAEKQRRKKLGNAFAMDDDQDDEDEKKREAELLRRKAERKRGLEASTSQQAAFVTPAEASAALATLPAGGTPGTVISSSAAGASGDKDLANKLGFDGNLDPAEAFIRLQERKRKGRRSEFGGPPRGCSPWRDGKKGVITPLAAKRIEQEKSASVIR